MTVRQLHCSWIPNIMIYSNDIITWKRNSNICSYPKERSHLSMVRNYRLKIYITINNNDGETRPLFLKKMMIYSDNMIAWQHNCNLSSNTNNARSCRRSRCLVLSEWRHYIINPGHFFTGGPSAERRGDRGTLPMKDCLPSTASFLLQRAIPEVES